MATKYEEIIQISIITLGKKSLNKKVTPAISPRQFLKIIGII